MGLRLRGSLGRSREEAGEDGRARMTLEPERGRDAKSSRVGIRKAGEGVAGWTWAERVGSANYFCGGKALDSLQVIVFTQFIVI